MRLEKKTFRKYIHDCCRIMNYSGFHVYCITVPEELGKSRAAYFTWEGFTAESADGECSGPRRHLEEVIPLLDDRYKEYCRYGLSGAELPAEEGTILNDWLTRKEADDNTRYDD